MKLSPIAIGFSLALALIALPEVAAAAAGGGAGGEAEFGSIYTWIKGIITGTLGRFLAMAAFVIGLAMGIVRQSIIAAVIGIAFAIALAYGPSVIEGVFTATLENPVAAAGR